MMPNMSEKAIKEAMEKLQSLTEKHSEFSPEAFLYTIKVLCFSNGVDIVKKDVTILDLISQFEVNGWIDFSFLAGDVFKHWGLKDGSSFLKIVRILDNEKIIRMVRKIDISDLDKGRRLNFDVYADDMEKFNSMVGTHLATMAEGIG